MFVKCIPDILTEAYQVNYLAHSTSSIFNNFLGKRNWHIGDGKIDMIQKNELDQEVAKNLEVLEFGIPLHFSSKVKESQLRSLLKHYSFTPSNYMIALNNGDCLLDYRIFGILYDEINQTIFDRFNGVVDKKEEEHAKWLKREGEESYFYYSVDELITKVAETTLSELEKQGHSELYILCPISEKHNKFIARLCYTELLNSSIEVYDGKRIIHFCKMPLKEAIMIYKKIVDENPVEFPCLQKFIVDHLG